MASTYPSQLINASDIGRIEKGYKANLTVFSEDYLPVYTVLNGVVWDNKI
jgi:N-acetylglucosamine-6-phosphate deacetylase